MIVVAKVSFCFITRTNGNTFHSNDENVHYPFLIFDYIFSSDAESEGKLHGRS